MRMSLAVCLTIIGLTGIHAPASAAQPATQPTLETVLADLASSSFDTRQHAQEQLNGAMDRQILQMSTASDAETSGRLRAALEDQTHLGQWAMDNVKRLGKQESLDLLRFGLSPEVAPSLRDSFSSDAKTRDQGLAALMAMKGKPADQLLASLLMDADPMRRCYVIDALFDRPASDAISDVLWNMVGPELQGTRDMTTGFQGKNVTVKSSYRQYESPLWLGPASALLAKYQSPNIAKSFGTALKVMNNQNWPSEADVRGAATFQLALAFKSDAVLQYAYEKAIAPRNGSTSSNNFFYSNRTPMIALFAILTDQNPVDFGLAKGGWIPDVWTARTDEGENAAVEKVKEWWKANKTPGAATKAGN